ncbi:MAG TPA: DDE-type integrase/transposase/recombinase [Nitrososphaerales archaeon]|nr:DDE-type integrase/transposase/recombinase [Nitrososphaerales archaeon]
MAKLDSTKIAYLIKAKEERGETTPNIALQLGVTRRRVEQILSLHRKSGRAPVLQKPGRKSVPVTEEESQIILETYSRYKTNALYLERMIEDEKDIHINHNRIHNVLLMNSLAGKSRKKWIRRKYVRYERDHSNSLWHTDWHEIKDRRWKGKWLTAYEDDASRFITGFGVHETFKSEYSVAALERAIKEHGKPASILLDHGTTFYSMESERREKGMTEFEKCLLKHKIRFILGRVNHPQTNGKIEKFFDIFEQKISNGFPQFQNSSSGTIRSGPTALLTSRLQWKPITKRCQSWMLLNISFLDSLWPNYFCS